MATYSSRDTISRAIQPIMDESARLFFALDNAWAAYALACLNQDSVSMSEGIDRLRKLREDWAEHDRSARR